MSLALLAALLLAGAPPEALQLKEAGDQRRAGGDPAGAREAYQAYLALRPEDLDARLGLAEALRDLGERDAALEAYQAFLGLAQPIPDEAGRVEKAGEAMAVLQQPSPSGRGHLDSPDAKGGEGSTATPTAVPRQPSPFGEGPAATAVLRQPSPSGRGHSDSPDARGGEGSTATSTPTPVTPATEPRAVIVVPVPAAIPPSPPSAGAPRSAREEAALQKLRLGDRLLAEGETRLALFAYQDAVNQDPRSAEARLKLGRVYLRLEHLGEALEQFSVAEALDPGNPEVRRAAEEARARAEGRAPPPGAPIIVRLPPGSSLPETPPAASP